MTCPRDGIQPLLVDLFLTHLACPVGAVLDSTQRAVDFRELFSFCIRQIEEEFFGVRCFGFIASILDYIWFHFFGLVEDFVQRFDNFCFFGEKLFLVALFILLSQSIPPYLA